MHTSIGSFATTGVVPLQYPARLREAVENADKSWRSLCALPVAVKKDLFDSYEFKDGNGPRADRKENLDLTLAACIAWLDDHQELDDVTRTARTFVQDAARVVEHAAPTVLQFAESVEEEFRLEGFADEVKSGTREHFFVRFIYYPGDRGAGEEIATPHADNGGFTLHLFESDPGLQAFTHDTSSEWIETPVDAGETVIFPGMQMQLRSKGMITALWHRVLSIPRTQKSGRYSAVCFVHLPKTLEYDKQTWGRLQEMEPGFNYNMPIEDFQKFFKK
jgi:hypothetical protein